MKHIMTCCSYFLFFSIPSFAVPVIQKIQTFYPINGSTGDELRKEMNDSGPNIDGEHFDAQTTWHIDWHYTWHYDNPSQNPCYLTASNVTVTITTLFPQWLNQSDAPAYLSNKWNTYMTALQNHEKGHEINGIAAATEIENALSKMKSMPDCKTLKTKIAATAKEILLQHNIWDKQYDIDTNHGKNQGAIFP